MSILIVGICVHFIFLFAIFDIYFQSPLILNLTPQKPDYEIRPAQRLVLFVADGLPAYYLYSTQGQQLAENLWKIMNTSGCYGISHTRVPTESRPGHVAIIAGFYEDPSAITKGWKENPVEFDSLFNQSTYTWSWGSPDILPMFAKGVKLNNMEMDTYSSEEQDFSGKRSPSLLDKWVFDRVETFFQNAQANSTLNEALRKPGNVLFLHLLGLDTAGHSVKTHSPEYNENLKLVDIGIKKMYDTIENFFEHDGKTSYIFTSDHGMTSWGSHGSGDPEETQTPLIAWGAGIKGGSRLLRNVNQADIAPLMATLIGIPIPVNSVGVLPLEYLDLSLRDLAEVYLANALQIFAQFKQRRKQIESNTLPFLYRPYKPLENVGDFEKSKREIRASIGHDDLFHSIQLTQELIQQSLIGLDYYQNYYQTILLTALGLGYIGWLANLLIDLSAIRAFSSYNSSSHFPSTKTDFGALILGLTILLATLVQSLPIRYLLYLEMPVVLGWKALTSLFNMSLGVVPSNVIVIRTILFVFGVEILVLGFLHRGALSLAILCLALWPFVDSSNIRHAPRYLRISWFLSCFSLAIFPLVPVVGRTPSSLLVVWSGVAWFLVQFGWKYENSRRALQWPRYLRLLCLCTAIILFHLGTENWKGKRGLPLLNQLAAWGVLGTSLLLPSWGSDLLIARLWHTMTSLVAPFLLLSGRHEGWFLLCLSATLICWLRLEYWISAVHSPHSKLEEIYLTSSSESIEKKPLKAEDFRRAYFFLVFLLAAFFGTGNLASLNSFDPSWTRCFLAVFAPFAMTSLIIAKTLAPLLFVTSTFRAICLAVKVAPGRGIAAVLLFSDALAFHLALLVTNRGSWLEIGTSLTHYVIMLSIIVLTVLLNLVAWIWSRPSSDKFTPFNVTKAFKGV